MVTVVVYFPLACLVAVNVRVCADGLFTITSLIAADVDVAVTGIHETGCDDGCI